MELSGAEARGGRDKEGSGLVRTYEGRRGYLHTVTVNWGKSHVDRVAMGRGGRGRSVKGSSRGLLAS